MTSSVVLDDNGGFATAMAGLDQNRNQPSNVAKVNSQQQEMFKQGRLQAIGAVMIWLEYPEKEVDRWQIRAPEDFVLFPKEITADTHMSWGLRLTAFEVALVTEPEKKFEAYFFIRIQKGEL